LNTTTAHYFVRNRYLDVLCAAPCLGYLMGPIDDGRGTELVQALHRLGGDEPDIVFIPVLREPETTDLRGPALWMELRDAAEEDPAEETLNEPTAGAYEMENCPPGSGTIILYVSKHDTPQSLADSTRRCELLRNWLQPAHPDGARVAVFCDLDKSSASPELLEALQPLIETAPFVITCDEEIATEWTSDGDGAVQPRIHWCPEKALPIIMCSLAGALSARTLHRRYRNSVVQLTETMEQLADLQFDYEKLLNASQKLVVGAKLTSYRDLVRRTQQLVRKTVPAKSTILVVSKGDPELLNLENRRGLHYPQGKDGTWAGHYPTNSTAAITQLERLRAKGAEYFLVPAVYNWWLDYYKDLAHHLSARYRVAVAEPDIATIFDLRSIIKRNSAPVSRTRRPKVGKRRSRSAVRQTPSRLRRSSRKTASRRH
jgi:hypothetical protein